MDYGPTSFTMVRVVRGPSYLAFASPTTKDNEGGIKKISLSNIRPIIIYFHSSQCRLILYLHQSPIFFKANSIHSSKVPIEGAVLFELL
jgi:hypothetical protein